jgi:hypothetical protein
MKKRGKWAFIKEEFLGVVELPGIIVLYKLKVSKNKNYLE